MIRILIVEDDQLLQEMYALKFELEGFEVQTASDGQAGLELALQIRPDVIILDNLMPRLSGLEVLERYNAEAPGHGSHVFLLSNKSAQGDVEESKRLGACGYLIKSQYAPKDVLVKVQDCLASHG